MPPTPDRRLVILAEGNFGFHHGKTAMGVIRFGTDAVVAVIDSTQAGRNVREWLGDSGRFDIPIVASLNDALGFLPRANALLIGIAPDRAAGCRTTGARSILAAIRSGLDILSGLHTFLGDDPELAEAARSSGVRIVDYRRPPERTETAVGRRHGPGKRVILTVGTDCAIGKMSVALELRRAAPGRGPVGASFVPTGQTGMMIEGWGVAVDRVIADFVQGTAEWLVEEGERRGDWVLVEGQGSLDHPAYSSVTLGLIHGAHAARDGHGPQARHGRPRLRPPAGRRGSRSRRCPGSSPSTSRSPALVAPSKVVAVALNTSLIHDEAEARRIIAATAAETGPPVRRPGPLRRRRPVARDRGGRGRAAVGDAARAGTRRSRSAVR